MPIDVEFNETNQRFDVSFGDVSVISDGSYARGYAAGHAAGQSELIDEIIGGEW